MSVRKREWVTKKGEHREAWVVAYTDQHGARHIKTFAKKKEADAYRDEVAPDVRSGTHVPPHKSPTVKQAGEMWLKASADNEVERSTLKQYSEHFRLHLVPFIGSLKLTEITPQAVRKLESDLLDAGRSRALTRKILVSLSGILGEAVELGLTPRNAVRELRRNRKGKDRRAQQRQKRKLKVGVDIPTPDEVKAILAHAKPRWRPLLVTFAFTGLRASEVRGLRWTDVDLKKNEIHVRQKADYTREIGAPKSEASQRTVPLPASVASILREWKVESPFKRPEDFVFPTLEGKGLYHRYILEWALWPAQEAAGLLVEATNKDGTPLLDKKGKPTLRAKYTGLHALRHFYASWCINLKKDGGLGLNPMNVKDRMGHSKIAITMDTYGHLFPRSDDSEELDEAAASLLA